MSNPADILDHSDVHPEVEVVRTGPEYVTVWADCPVCWDPFRGQSPRQLPCGHVFCLRCLKYIAKTTGMWISCPMCRRDLKIPHGNPKHLPKYVVDKMAKVPEKSIVRDMDAVSSSTRRSGPVRRAVRRVGLCLVRCGEQQ